MPLNPQLGNLTMDTSSIGQPSNRLGMMNITNQLTDPNFAVGGLPGVGGPQPDRDRLVKTVMGAVQPMGGPAAPSWPTPPINDSLRDKITGNIAQYRPSPGMAANNIARDTGNSTDPWAIVGNRNQPDKVEMPLATGFPNIKSIPAGAVNPQTMRNVAIANQAPQWSGPVQRPALPANTFRPFFAPRPSFNRGMTQKAASPFPQFRRPR